MVHEEVEGLFFPGTAGVLVAAQAAQQLDAGSVAGGVVSTAGGSIKKQKKNTAFQLQAFPLKKEKC